jgi:hypothetical protein
MSLKGSEPGCQIVYRRGARVLQITRCAANTVKNNMNIRLNTGTLLHNKHDRPRNPQIGLFRTLRARLIPQSSQHEANRAGARWLAGRAAGTFLLIV